MAVTELSWQLKKAKRKLRLIWSSSIFAAVIVIEINDAIKFVYNLMKSWNNKNKPNLVNFEQKVMGCASEVT